MRLKTIGAVLCLGSALCLAEDAAPAGPAGRRPVDGISDNSFFIEEAYNQERGVVQHIQSVLWGFDREGDDATRSFTYEFTQEWPLGGVRHQLSYTLPYERLDGDQPHSSGAGDFLVNYRLQALQETPTRFAFAPRLSLVFQTGGDEDGVDPGSVGYLINLPFSKKIGDFVHLHLNAGGLLLPGVRREVAGSGWSGPEDLFTAHAGAGVFLLLRPDFNVLLEALVRSEEHVDESGDAQREIRTLFAPGARYAINTRAGVQIVLGASVPVYLSEAGDDVGFLAYLSLEHPFNFR